MDFQKLLAIVDKNVDQKGLAKDLVTEFVKPLLVEFAAKTENKIDDVAVDLIVGAIDKALA